MSAYNSKTYKKKKVTIEIWYFEGDAARDERPYKAKMDGKEVSMFEVKEKILKFQTEYKP